jgi:ABC-2 type transport system permease protein
MSKFLRETWLIFNRNFVRSLRQPMWIIVGLFQPILYLLLFAPLLNGLHIPGFDASGSMNGFFPGLLVMITLFTCSFAGSGLLPDLTDGVVERLRVTPANRFALLLGMLLQDVFIFLVQCALLAAVATLMGLRANLGGLIVAFGLVALVGLMMASLSYAFALIFKNQSTLAAIVTTLTLPLSLLAGVLLPLSLAPQALRTVSNLTPFSHAVDAARALVNGQFGDSSIPLAFVLVAALMTLALFWSVRIFRQATA